ncbi:hypothetical protein O6H91_23G011500 [Diphasiastrum complanatum]|uniref:Uncharacterized protein n=1 Tax=Diphasiastrum complanatum TaxID=34168 RepID=A0ACC2A841_DIPCM|nr:hypothetical protein O6H91_23G011500 [Diphasiastrum complanatum]
MQIKNACTNLSRKIRVKRSKGMDPFGYEKICLLDSDVKKIDENFMHHTKSMFNIVTDGVGKSGFSLQCLKDWMAVFLEIDTAVVRVILSCQEDIWADNDLFEIVKGYFDISDATLAFCQVIHKYIKVAKTNLLLIQDAIESMPKHTQPTEANCKRVLDNLNKFMNADNPFPEEVFRKLEDLLLRQMKVQQKFEEQKKRVGKNLKRVKGWKKISSIIWGATCAGALVATVVTAFLSVVGVPVDVGVIAGVSCRRGYWADGWGIKLKEIC